MSFWSRVGIGVLVEAGLKLVTFIVDRVYDYKEKKLEAKKEINNSNETENNDEQSGENQDTSNGSETRN